MIHYVKANGRIINEAGIVGIYAKNFNVPVAFISGDNFTIAEANELFKNIVGVVVKESCGRDCAMSVSLKQSRQLLENGAKDATNNLLSGKITPMEITLPIDTEIKLYNTGYYISTYQKIYNLLKIRYGLLLRT